MGTDTVLGAPCPPRNMNAWLEIRICKLENRTTTKKTAAKGGNTRNLSDHSSNADDNPTVTDICHVASIAPISLGTYIDTDPQTADCNSTAGDKIN